jgi:hypothetical protein
MPAVMPVAPTMPAVGKEKAARNRFELTRGKFALREVIVGRKCHLVSPVLMVRDHPASGAKMSRAPAGCRDRRHVVVTGSASVAEVLMTRSIIGEQRLGVCPRPKRNQFA